MGAGSSRRGRRELRAGSRPKLIVGLAAVVVVVGSVLVVPSSVTAVEVLAGTVDSASVAGPRWTSTDYTPGASGEVTFALSWTGGGDLAFDVRVADTGAWVAANTSSTQPKSVTAALVGGVAYRVAVWARSGIGTYTLDASGATTSTTSAPTTTTTTVPAGTVVLLDGVADSSGVDGPTWTQVLSTPSSSGEHRFELDWTGAGDLDVDVRIAADRSWVAANTSAEHPKDVTVELSAGTTYAIAVWASSGTGTYTLSMTPPDTTNSTTTTTTTTTTATTTTVPDEFDCWFAQDGSTAAIGWIDDGGFHVLRRNDAWLASPGTGVDSYIDSTALPNSTYELRTWIGDTRRDRPCTDTGSPPPPPPPPPSDRVERVIHVSIDGLRADHVTPTLMPNLTDLRRQGASTLNARSDPALTQTLPNHHSQLTGRAVEGGGGHGVDYNNDVGRTVHQEAGGYVASVFDVVHDRGGGTVLYAGKSKFDMMDRNWSANGRADTVGVDDGRDKIDEYRNLPPSDAVDRLRTALNQRPNLEYAFFHIRDPDVAGHAYDWGSAQYRDAVEESDRILGRVLDVIESDPDWADSTAVIVVADHGGPLGADLHNDPSKPGSYIIPFVVWGPGVTSGADLYALNLSDREDPGGARVWLQGVQPIREHEVANVALDLLGYPPVPGSTFNLGQDLDY